MIPHPTTTTIVKQIKFCRKKTIIWQNSTIFCDTKTSYFVKVMIGKSNMLLFIIGNVIGAGLTRLQLNP